MRVALLTYSTRPRGGVVHTLSLAEALAELGTEVDVWTLARGGDTTFFRPVAPGVGVRAVPFEARDGETVGARIVRSIDTLRAAFDHAAYDVVHAQDCISANAALPCVRTIHHLDVFTTPELAACHERAVVEPTARICVSASVAAEVREGWGLEPTVIPNGVDAARFEAGARDAVRRAAWGDRLGDYVLALGGIEPRKGSIDLLEAYAALRTRRPSLRLVIGGGETLFDYRDYRAAFDARAAALGVEPVVLGTVEEDALPALVAQASALAMISTKEGFGLAAMEALAAGVPVVARDLPVLREVLGDAVAYGRDPLSIAAALDGVLAAPPDAGAGRDLARSYTWSAAARRHLAFYAGLDRSGRPSAPVRASAQVRPVSRPTSGEQPTVPGSSVRRVDDPPARPLRFLVVEDTEDIRWVTARMVQQLGHHADEAADGVEAVEALQAATYDVMLLDLSMPRMTGEDVVRWLRDNPEHGQGLRVVVVSAWGGERRGALDELGVDDYIAKPLRKAQLVQLVESTEPRS